MTAPDPSGYIRFEFSYTTIETGVPFTFVLAGPANVGLTEEIAHGIRTGLQTVASITDVKAVEVTETRQEVELPTRRSTRKK